MRQQQLRQLEASSMFLVPLDRRRGWYRYHALFREFLLGELRRVEPDLVEKLHLRAADWYEANGSPVLALEHLLHTNERDRCVAPGDRVDPADLQPRVRCRPCERWLVGARRRRHRGVSAARGHWPAGSRALAGQTADAQRWARSSTPRRSTTCPLDGSASFESARAMLRSMMCPPVPNRRWPTRTLAVAAEPPWSPWRDQALCHLRRGHLLDRRRRRGSAHCSPSPSSCPRRPEHRRGRAQRSRARVARDGPRAVGRGGRASRAGARRHRRVSNARLRDERSRLRRRRRDSRCTAAT